MTTQEEMTMKLLSATVLAAALLFSQAAHAELPETCKYHLRLVHNLEVQNRTMLPELVRKGEISKATARRLQEMAKGNRASGIALCVQLRLIQLDRKLFVTEAYAQREAEETAEEAARYYISLGR
jgi:hypothetical protein